VDQPYGSGGDTFGPVSAGVVVLLVLLVAAAIWIAWHPEAIHALAASVRDWPVVGRVRTWTREHVSRSGWSLAHRFPVGQVAGAALLATLVVVAALAAAFTVLLEDVLEGDGIVLVDQPAARWLAGHRDAWLTATLRMITMLGSPVGLAVLALVVSVTVAWRRRSWLPVPLGMVGAGGIGLVITTVKALVGRDRPPPPYAVITEGGYSFPSGHATGTAAVAVLSAWLLTRWLITSWAGRVAVWMTAIGLIAMVGFSRIYLGVHYLSDVLAGWLLGTAWAGAVVLVGSWWQDTRRTHTARVPPG
jgi:membrane-associated phospholipid phosphatase